MEKVYFSLGTNQGDREANIRKALNLMDERLGSPYKLLSSIIQTPSWGFEGPDFLNCAVMYELDADPFEVLAICKEIEREMGRTGQPEYDENGLRIYHDRPIDIDILYFGDRKIDSPTLTIPHPLIEKRDFVRLPLAEIAAAAPAFWW